LNRRVFSLILSLVDIILDFGFGVVVHVDFVDVFVVILVADINFVVLVLFFFPFVVVLVVGIVILAVELDISVLFFEPLDQLVIFVFIGEYLFFVHERLEEGFEVVGEVGLERRVLVEVVLLLEFEVGSFHTRVDVAAVATRESERQFVVLEGHGAH